MRKAILSLACLLCGGACVAPVAVAQEIPRRFPQDDPRRFPQEIPRWFPQENPGAFGPVPTGLWRLELDEELDGRVRANAQAGVLRLRVIHNRIFGQPADDDPDRARLAGEVVPGRATVVNWRQDNANIEGFTQFCTGRVVRAGLIVGTWYDTMGKAGDFVLSFGQR